MMVLALLAGCAAAPELPVAGTPGGVASSSGLPGIRYKAVLVAGDGELPVFDNAAEALAGYLGERGVAAGDVQRLSARRAVVGRDGVRSATLEHVLAAVEGMKPGPGEGCLVFASSHGAIGQGLVLTAGGVQVLRPAALDGALVRGCGDAPTAVVVSGCFTGIFAETPMARPNRFVLTAARRDRPSFGCGAGETLTFFDRCLLEGLKAGGTWELAAVRAKGCVTGLERAKRVRPSEPQVWRGPAVADWPLPVLSGAQR